MRRDDDDEEVDDDDEGGGYGTFIVTFASRMKTIASFILVILCRSEGRAVRSATQTAQTRPLLSDLPQLISTVT